MRTHVLLRRTLLLTLLLVLVGLGVGAAAAEAGVTTKRFFGVMVNGPLEAPSFDLDAEARRMRRAGVESWRSEIAWDQVEPLRGNFDWDATDARVAAAARNDIEVMALVVRAPSWASGSDNPFMPPRDPRAYARFMRALIARYGPRGEFWSLNPTLPRRPVRRWQIWNEPNIALYFARQPFAKPYARLLRTAYRAVKDADRGATVVLAGFANYSWRDLAKAYDAGIRRSFDIAAVHPFSGLPGHALKIMRLNREVMDRAGDRRKPMLISEVTWSSGKGQTQNNSPKTWETTEAGQAKKLREGYRLFIRERKRLRLKRIYWYTWASREYGPNSFDYAGLRKLMPDGTLADKPALGAFRAVVRRYGR
jgi:hypothetical protein